MPTQFAPRFRVKAWIVVLLALLVSSLTFGATAASAEESSSVPRPTPFDRDGLDEDEIVVPETYPSSPSGIPDPRSVDYVVVPEGRGLSAHDNPHSTGGATSITIEARYRVGWGLADSWTFTFTNGKSSTAPNKFWVQRGRCDTMHSRTPLTVFVQNTKDAGARYLPDVRVQAERIPDAWSPIGGIRTIGRVDDGQVGSTLFANQAGGGGLLPGRYNITYYGDWDRSGRPVGGPIGRVQVFIPSCDGYEPPPGTWPSGHAKSVKPKLRLRHNRSTQRLWAVVNGRKVDYTIRARVIGIRHKRVVQRKGFRVKPHSRVTKIYRAKPGVRYRLIVREKVSSNKWKWRAVTPSRPHRSSR